MFHLRMICCQNILPPLQVEQFKGVFRDYLALADRKDPQYFARHQSATELISYLEHHSMDPDNALVGLTPSKAVMTSFSELLEKNTQTVTTQNTQEISSSHSASSSSDADNGQLSSLSSSLSSSSDLDRSGPARAKRTKAITPRPMSVRLNPRPDYYELVVVKTRENPSRVIYARVENRSPQVITVFPEPTEMRTIEVKPHECASFPKEMKVMLNDVRTAQRIVCDPIDELYDELITEIKGRTTKFLIAQGLDLDLLEKCSHNEISIPMYIVLHEMKEKLDYFIKNQPSQLLDDVRQYAAKKVSDFLEKDLTGHMYLPTQARSLRQLKGFDFGALGMARIQRCQGVCDSALLQLRLHMRDLMDGSSKRKLTDWWLIKIEDAVAEWLDNIGYRADAVPENYTAKPPDDHKLIHSNLALIQEVLNRKEDKHNVQEFLDNLKNEIYPRINQFVDHARIVIASQLELRDKQFDVEETQRRFELTKASLDPKIVDWITEMLKDIEYLEEMREMEKQSEPGKLQLSNVVPIGGLILSCFFRIENELKTILDLWPDPEVLAQKRAALKAKALAPTTTTTVVSPSSSSSSPALPSGKKPPGLSQSTLVAGDSSNQLLITATSTTTVQQKNTDAGDDSSSRPYRPSRPVYPSIPPPSPPSSGDANTPSKPAKPPKPARPSSTQMVVPIVDPSFDGDAYDTELGYYDDQGEFVYYDPAEGEGDAFYDVAEGEGGYDQGEGEGDYYDEGEGDMYYDTAEGEGVYDQGEGEGDYYDSVEGEGGYDQGEGQGYHQQDDIAYDQGEGEGEGYHQQDDIGEGKFYATTSTSPPQVAERIRPRIVVGAVLEEEYNSPSSSSNTPLAEPPMPKLPPSAAEDHRKVITKVYANGDKYTGQYKDGKRDGRGVYQYANGDIYEGQYQDGLFNGHGIFRFFNGDIYNGQFEAGLFHGTGSFSTDAFQYVGGFKEDQFHGHGVCTFHNGEQFEGTFAADQRNGFGVYTYSDGTRYEGMYTNGITSLDGDGKFFGCDGLSEAELQEKLDSQLVM